MLAFTLSFFFFGMLVFIVLMLTKKLYRFDATKLRVRKLFAVWLLSFFSAFWFFMSLSTDKLSITLTDIPTVLILAALLGFFLFYLERKSYLKMLKGVRIIYPTKQRRRIFTIAIVNISINIIIVVVLINIGIHKLPWIGPVIMGLFLALWGAQLAMLIHIIRLERVLGSPIVENVETEKT